MSCKTLKNRNALLKINSCKLAWHSIDNNREKVTWTRYSARADRAGFDGKATHLNMRKQAYFSPRRNVRLPKKPCFAPILTFKPHLWYSSFKAVSLHSTLLFSAVLYPSLRYWALLSSSPLLSTLLNSPLLYTLLYSSPRLDSTRPDPTLLCSALLCSTLLYSTLLYCAALLLSSLLYSTRLYSTVIFSLLYSACLLSYFSTSRTW